MHTRVYTSQNSKATFLTASSHRETVHFPCLLFTTQSRRVLPRAVDVLQSDFATDVVHAFERQLGMDRADIDAKGELFVQGATSLPQRLLVGEKKVSQSIASGWLPLNGELQTIGSSDASNLEGRFAVDNDLRTWWQSSETDKEPTLTTSLMAPSTIHAIRIVWRDVGLDTQRGIQPGPIRYCALQCQRDVHLSNTRAQPNDQGHRTPAKQLFDFKKPLSGASVDRFGRCSSACLLGC